MTPPAILQIDLVQLGVPIFLLLTIVEVIWARSKRRSEYELGDTMASATLGFGRFILTIFSGLAVYMIMKTVEPYALLPIGFQWWAFVLILFADEFVYYWWHRYSHECPIMWAAHAVHHSSRHFNMSTAIRQPWTDHITLGFLPWTILAVIGFPPELIFFQFGVSQVYQYFLHTDHVGKLPRPIEFLFNTPSHHRVHHASNPRYLDANYGGVLIIYDRLFGTFVEECEERPRYGLTNNVATFNPLRLVFFEWARLIKDWRDAPDWKTVLLYAFAKPGWRHDGTGKTTADLQAEWRARTGQLQPDGNDGRDIARSST